MKRVGSFGATLGLLLVTSFSFGQDFDTPLPPASSDILGPPLITWTEQQRPRPLPDSTQVTEALRDQAGWESFTGIVVEVRGVYFLKAADGRLYRLDNPQTANRYEGRKVQLTGSIEEDGQGIQIMSIEEIL